MDCIYCHSTNFGKRGFTRKGIQKYRCTDCGREFTEQSRQRPPRKPYPEVIECLTCGAETTNPKFCSRSCAAIYTNKQAPKRKAVPRYCKHCGAQIRKGRSVCDACNPSMVDWNTRTVGELYRAARYQGNAQIRENARSVYRASYRPKCCQRCGYSKYFEVCHIRAVSEFPDDARITEVNHIDNLLGLCPNCHWEFDHGLLGYEDGAFVEMRGTKRYSDAKRTR